MGYEDFRKRPDDDEFDEAALGGALVVFAFAVLLLFLLVLAVMFSGCGPIRPAPAPQPNARAAVVHTHVPHAIVEVSGAGVTALSLEADDAGDLHFALPSTVAAFNVNARKAGAPAYPGFVATLTPGLTPVEACLGPCQPNGANVLIAGPAWPIQFDPSTIPLTKLAQIRGSMWTARYPMPWGPRPNDPTNILVVGAIHSYGNKDDREAAFKAYTDRGYTHAVDGAWNPAGNSGYHGLYPIEQPSFDEYLDQLQDIWDHGIAPVVFIKPDNWTCSDLETLTPYYSQPRAQRLVRIAVPGGWEPSQDTSNAEYVCWLQWGARVLPNALRLLHMTADFDAPGNNDDLTPGTAKFLGNAEVWRRVAPYLHGFLSQVGGYVFSGNEVPNDGFKTEFCKLFSHTRGAGGLKDRFLNGYGGWPTFSAWGPSTGMFVYAAEFAAYGDYTYNFNERYARDLGDFAISCGSDGYLDGGRVPAPER